MASRILLCGIAAALVSASVALAHGGASGGAPPSNGQIAFASNRDGDYEIYAMNPDGTGVTRLTYSPGWDCCPAWSPDGTRLVFVSYRDGNNELYRMDANGANVTRLTFHPAFDWEPAWSPDGQVLAFATERDGNFEIYRMNLDGGGLLRLTYDANDDRSPAWSPDGTRLAFEGRREGRAYPDIFLMQSDGTGVTRLTTNEGWDGAPAWSPDGSRIAFTATRVPPPPPPPPMPPTPDDFPDVYTITPQGTNLTRLTLNYRSDLEPAWSPDGAKIAFYAAPFNSTDVLVMSADGSGQTNLTNNGFGIDDWFPDWQRVPPPPPPPPPPLHPPPPPPPPPPSVTGYPCVVPRVVGLRLPVARRKIRRAHCSVGRVRRKRSRRSRVGRVIWQSPKPGAVKSMSWRVALLVGRR